MLIIDFRPDSSGEKRDPASERAPVVEVDGGRPRFDQAEVSCRLNR